MFLKKTLVSFFVSFLLLIPNTVLAYSDYIYAGGENIGIDVKSKGVIIVGTYKIDTIDISLKSGLKVGDIITKINDNVITNIEDLTTSINNTNKQEIKVEYIRNNKLLTTTLKLLKVDNSYKTGLYVKDNITGIGTLTFVDPNTKLFGALGHEIIEKNSGMILNVDSGTIFHSEVVGIEPSSEGLPGEKKAKYYSDLVFGNIIENTNKGIFGNYHKSVDETNLYKVAKYDDIEIGPAKIRTVINGTNVKEYDIKIITLNKNSKTKNLLFEITDSDLLDLTGGIVQGMSGSPIIQGEYIIGAVTHVVVESPKKGYGIFIVNMLEEAEN